MERITYLNRYRVVADQTGAPVELRRSGSAVTYKAEDIHSGEEVAVEVIPAFGLRAVVREELEREALAAKQLTHINIAALHAFGTEADHLIYASEYFDGTSGEAWVTAHGPMPISPVLRIALQVVSALGAAAFHGIVHHAITPRNVILVPGQTPQGDWPLVKILNLVGVAPTFAGSHAAAAEADFGAKFASPEQLQHGTVDFRSEIYSLGSTLWFLLTGAAPVAEVALPRVGGLPKPVMQLLSQMLSPNPEARPHDPLAFQEHIRGCLAQVERREAIGRKFGVPVPAAVPVIRNEPRRPIPWKPLAIAASVLAIATLAALLVPDSLRPGQLFAGFGREKPIGVAVGVPDASAPAADPNTADDVAQISPETLPAQASTSSTALPDALTESAPAPPTVASNAIETPQPPEIVAANQNGAEPSETAANIASAADAPVSEEQPSAAFAQTSSTPAVSETDGYANQNETASPPVAPPLPIVSEDTTQTPQLVATNEDAVTEGNEPAPPSEGPAEIATPPTYAAQEPEAVEASRAPEEDSPSASDVAAIEAAPAPTPARVVSRTTPALEVSPAIPAGRVAKTNKRPRRINGKEVRVAEPAGDDGKPVPGLPARSRRARFLGTAPDGSFVFELPSSQQGFYRPPPVK